MGAGSFSATDYASFARSTVGKRTEEIYTSRGMHKSLDPLGVKGLPPPTTRKALGGPGA